jgi:hypothetical protein
VLDAHLRVRELHGLEATGTQEGTRSNGSGFREAPRPMPQDVTCFPPVVLSTRQTPPPTLTRTHGEEEIEATANLP